MRRLKKGVIWWVVGVDNLKKKKTKYRKLRKEENRKLEKRIENDIFRINKISINLKITCSKWDFQIQTYKDKFRIYSSINN